jgi:hypothetical protein
MGGGGGINFASANESVSASKHDVAQRVNRSLLFVFSLLKQMLPEPPSPVNSPEINATEQHVTTKPTAAQAKAAKPKKRRLRRGQRIQYSCKLMQRTSE